MNTHLIHVANAFNKAAASYNESSDIQMQCGNQLISQLSAVQTQFKNVIDAGCGTGRTTAQLAANISYDQFTAIDIAAKMLPADKYKSGIHFLNEDYHNIHHHSIHYDLVFSNLALHWSHDLSATFHSIHQALNARGLLAFSIPLHGTFIELSDHFSVHDFKSLEFITQSLMHHKLRLISHHQHTFTCEFPDTLSALQSIKRTGTNYVPQRRHAGLCGRHFLSQCNIRQLTYRIGFFIAEKQHA